MPTAATTRRYQKKENTMAEKTHTDNFKDYLRGIARYQSCESLEHLKPITSWVALAKKEVETRAKQLIRSLDPATLQALADGEIDVQQAIQNVLDEQR
jgi:phosphomevalonate kinase